MAFLRGRDTKVQPSIFTASMADIIFLLIIFFVLTYKTDVDRVQVELPKTMVRQELPEEAAVISIDDNAVIRVSTGKEMSLPVNTQEEVISFASGVVAENPNQAFVIKAGQTCRYEHVDSVLDALKQAKAKVIYLLSDQRTVDD